VVPKHIRSTVLISSRTALQGTPHYEAYERQLPPAARDALRDTIAGVWLPLDLAIAHYSACETLGFPPADQVAMGRKTGERVNGTLLGTIARLAHSAGVTPWTLIEQLSRFWRRGFDGADVTFEKLGPKEARVSLVDLPLLQISYFRNGLAGTCEAQLMPFCARAFVRVERYRPGQSVATYRYQWA
jgi:hypothetical protein